MRFQMLGKQPQVIWGFDYPTPSDGGKTQDVEDVQGNSTGIQCPVSGRILDDTVVE